MSDLDELTEELMKDDAFRTEYAGLRLSGSFCTDYSDASGMLLLDVKRRRWSREMLSICRISEEQMPHLYESYEAVGTLKPDIAAELGFPASVKIIAGAFIGLRMDTSREEMTQAVFEGVAFGLRDSGNSIIRHCADFSELQGRQG